MRRLRRAIRALAGSLALLVVIVVVMPAAAGVTAFAALVFLPLPATLPVPKPLAPLQPTVLYDRAGNVIATLAGSGRRVPVAEKDIPQVLKEAVVADEDRSFYHETGINIRGTLRALWSDLRGQGPLQGGSTITQQYVKLAYTNAHRTLARKVREAILASQLARQASKDQILYRYLTIVYFGDGNYGVGAAAQDYFHTPVQDLDASEAATLAGLIPAPSARAPRENLAGAEQARELVLGKMRQQGYLTAAEYRAAMAERLALAGTGTAPPPRATLIHPRAQSASPYPDFVDYVTRWLLAHYPASEVYGGGLRVQTTLDPAVQAAAYAAVRGTLAGTADPLEMALAAVEPRTGFVEALVGGRDFGHGPFADDNLAIGGCDPPPKGGAVAVAATCWSGASITGGTPGRQPGSAWKPFVLATALGQGIAPSAVYPAPGIYQIPGCKVPAGAPASACQIHNDEPGAVIGSETLAQATAESTNTVYAQVAEQVGCPAVAATAKRLGVQSSYYATPPFYHCASYALGELDVSPLDMAAAYAVFANHGEEATPTPILQVVSPSGKVLVDNITHAPATVAALPANVADNVTSVLQGVLLPGGTAASAGLGRPAAGKTGTTNNYTNAWFVGYTPTLSAAVWMGNAQSQSTPIGAVKGVDPVYGGTWPATTWKVFMQAALQGVPVTPFSAPAPITPPPAALPAPATTAPPVVGAGPPGVVGGTPPGGPYVLPTPQPVAPPPATTVPPTTAPGTTTPTTGPGTGSTTTTTTVPGGGRSPP